MCTDAARVVRRHNLVQPLRADLVVVVVAPSTVQAPAHDACGRAGPRTRVIAGANSSLHSARLAPMSIAPTSISTCRFALLPHPHYRVRATCCLGCK